MATGSHCVSEKKTTATGRTTKASHTPTAVITVTKSAVTLGGE